VSATTADIRRAAEILGDNAGVGGGHALGAASIVVDRVIDQVINTRQLAGGLLPEPFNGWIIDALATFHETLTSLTGDSSRIGAHIGHLVRAAGVVGAQLAGVAQTRSTAQGCWEGPGAQAFERRIDAVGLATRGLAGVLAFSAERHLVLASQQADAKRGVIRLVAQLASDLVQAAVRFLNQMGVSLAMGGWDVVSNTVGGAFSGAASGASRGWSSGGFVGAVGGFFSGLFGGGADGFRRGVEEAKARIRAAFDNFVSWALRKLAEILHHVHDFVKRHVDTMVTTVGQISGAGVRSGRAAALLRGRGDPGTHADRPTHGSYGDRAAGADPRRMDGDLIGLNLAIGDPSAKLPDGYERATPADLAELGLTPDLLTDPNGFQAEVFRTPDGSYVVAFPGTGAGGGAFMPDAVEDAVGGATMSQQTGNVLRITDALQRSGNANNVVFTGHSLGGRLAAVAALDTGNAAVTYDAAGVSQATINYIAQKNGVDPATLVERANEGQIRRYYAGNDPLTAAQERWPGYASSLPDAVGKPFPIGPINHSYPTGTDIGSLGYDHGHDLTTMDDLWRQRYGHLSR
jgi:dienelactone hydrolase